MSQKPALLAEVTLVQLDLQRLRRSFTSKVSQQQRNTIRDPLAISILPLSDLIPWGTTDHSSLLSLLLHIPHWARAATNTSHDLTLPRSMPQFSKLHFHLSVTSTHPQIPEAVWRACSLQWSTATGGFLVAGSPLLQQREVILGLV